MTYADKLKDPRWQKKRLEVLNRDNFTCQMCHDTETTLHVHHFCYPKSRNPWDSELSDLICFCEACHSIAEDAKITEKGDWIVDARKFISTKGNQFVLCLCKSEKGDLFFIVYEYSNNTLKQDAVLSPPMMEMLIELNDQWKEIIYKKEVCHR